jgi:hypothetical protein
MRRLAALLLGLSLAGCAHTPAPTKAEPTATQAPAPQASEAERSDLVTQANQAYEEHRLDEALVLYRRLWELGERSVSVLYNAACVASLSEQKQEALQWLERSADAGLDDAEYMAKDPDLASLRDDPAFARVVEKVKATAERKNAAAEPALRDELLQRAKMDQEVRVALMANRPGQEPTPEQLERLKQVDQDNTRWLKTVVAKHGWPGRTLVGEKASWAALLLIQHADLDPAFQQECLVLMEKAARAGQADSMSVADITDRTLVNAGKRQRYGTQFTEKDGVLVPQAIEDAGQVDARRASIGLGTLAEYAELMHRTFKKPTSVMPLAEPPKAHSGAPH